MTEYTGPESFVSSLIGVHCLSWFPRHQAMSLQLSPQNEDKMDNQAMYHVSHMISNNTLLECYL